MSGKQIKKEWRRIIWPDKKEMTKKTMAVVGIGFVLSLCVAAVDFGAQYLVNFIANLF